VQFKVRIHECRVQENQHIVLGTGRGNLPAVRFLAFGSVQFGSVPDPAKNPTRIVLAGLLHGPDMNPQVSGLVRPGPQFHFTVLTTLAILQHQ